MSNAHYFLVDDIGAFIASLLEKAYARSPLEEEGASVVRYSKILSAAMQKSYSFNEKESGTIPLRIGVRYHLINEGKSLAVLARKLKELNALYRDTLPGWKTKREPSAKARKKRSEAITAFLRHHAELIDCFKYQPDHRTEGNHSFNLEIASTPVEQTVCFEFIKALVDAYSPHRIRRSRREPDKPSRQRNGWIKRYAQEYKQKGWSTWQISRRIQRELREGTWNERSRLQYNLAPNTICRIAGLKLQSDHRHHTLN